MDDAPAKLLKAAGPIFAETGFEKTTIREICRAAGTNVAAVNYHFGDKERLYIESVKLASRQRAVEVPFPKHPDGTAPEARLHAFVKTMLTRALGADRQSWQIRLMMREILQPTAACRELVEEYFRPDFSMLLEILGEMVPANTEPFRIRQMGFSVIGQCVHYRFAGRVVEMLTPAAELKEQFTIEKLADHICRFSLFGITRADSALPDMHSVAQ